MAMYTVNLARSKEAAISDMRCAFKFKDGAQGKGNVLFYYGKPGSPTRHFFYFLILYIRRFSYAVYRDVVFCLAKAPSAVLCFSTVFSFFIYVAFLMFSIGCSTHVN